MASPRKTRSQGPAEAIDLDHPPKQGKNHLDVEEELAFYSSYHSNKVNQIIHFMCIPLILWSWLLIASHLPIPGTSATILRDGLAYQPSLAMGWIVAYLTYYVLLEPVGGLTYLPIGTLLYLTSTYLAVSPPSWLPFTDPFKPSAQPFAWAVFFASWIAQFIGHGVFEHRAPALVDNLVQALVLAPFFVHLEALFAFFNYKPDLHKKIKNKAGVRIRDMNRAAKLK
ncbi:endoplasmic reticulum protein [Kwoniella mangroviensis CBS 10435]|uniref:Endoplasmic reticulum protein n=1 Tax=Kwoniella mangroviensis CBS 10435 TaxID=1331196 RepID=A0A1B9IJ21_9TREE|nr:endoplasmic reticulum protein [Kwoniella mangroviensis CBS 8507]OCF55535.1 endoplasmic reticulum protein [Kwoniella mangroviensis CBS 10435]OCF63309.1 endoplasmic reticulum protein [Kwoniella mangroviensis CBS 8507]OCF73736.1 endoplasmic reticulum protein [Kwoniella mangroviensis CBS 8886]